eukprot:SAG25_NODE_1459_length_2972_cov_1.956491_2_plen_58_part_00
MSLDEVERSPHRERMSAACMLTRSRAACAAGATPPHSGTPIRYVPGDDDEDEDEDEE